MKVKKLIGNVHLWLGLTSGLVVFILGVTGCIWAFDWFDNGVQWLANGGKPAPKEAPIQSDTTLVASVNPLDKIHRTLVQAYPEAEMFYISIPQEAKGAYSVYVDAGNLTRTQNDRLWFDQYSGKEVSGKTFADLSGGEKVWTFNYDIHVGAII